MDRTNSMGLWRYSSEFLRAGVAVLEAEGDSLVMPLCYLYCHSLELAFKAFLRGSGMTLDELIRIGHDLKKACEEARAAGLDRNYKLSSVDLETVRGVSDYYRCKQFEYIVTGTMRLPLPGNIKYLLENLLPAIEPFCQQQKKRHDSQP